MLKSMSTSCGLAVDSAQQSCVLKSCLFTQADVNLNQVFISNRIFTRIVQRFYQTLSSTIYDIFYLLSSELPAVSTAPIATTTVFINKLVIVC
jgi:hypothetical protein